MNTWWKWIGASGPPSGSLDRWTIGFQTAPDGGWVLAGLVLAALAAWWTYHRSPHPLLVRRAMAGLRFLFLAGIILLLHQPSLTLTLLETGRRELILLVDDSASMRIRDRRTDPADVARAAMALGALPSEPGRLADGGKAKAGDFATLTRLDLARAALTNAENRILEQLEGDYAVTVEGFAGETRDDAPPPDGAPPAIPKAPTPVAGDSAAAALARLSGSGKSTALGEAVARLVAARRGQPVAGIVLVTDGANNSGMAPLEAAALAADAKIPLHAYGTGIAAPRDLAVVGVFADELVFIEDEVAVTARLRGGGMSGATVRAELKVDGQTMAAENVVLDAKGDGTARLVFKPKAAGDIELRVEVPVLADETVPENNARTARVRVIDKRIKVLWAEDAPRYEFKHLLPLLLRDKRLEMKIFLRQADPTLRGAEGSPLLEAFPATEAELAAFDVLMLGDVDPKAFTPQQTAAIARLVSDFGGGLIAIAGRNFMPGAWMSTPVGRVLPIESARAAAGAAQPSEKPIRLSLTAAGHNEPGLRLADSDAENARLWEAFAPVYWAVRVAGLKPGAQALLVDPGQDSGAGGMPVVATQTYGLGRSFFVGTDNTWRWRRNRGEAAWVRLWSGLIQRLALQRLLGETKRTQLTLDRLAYQSGDRVAVYARLYDKSLRPLQAGTVEGAFAPRDKSGKRAATPETPVVLNPVPDQPGVFRGEFPVVAEGAWQFYVKPDPAAGADFDVAPAAFELGDTALNAELLMEIAATGGGGFFREESLTSLPDRVRASLEKALASGGAGETAGRGAKATARGAAIETTAMIDLWSSPAFFALLLLPALIEWTVRRRLQLK